MLEETGISLRLGRPIAEISYLVEKNEEKIVYYWSSKVREKALKKNKFQANDEISKIRWEKADDAIAKLSYKHDQKLLKDVIRIHQAGELETRALVLLRHATATPRSEWKALGQFAERFRT
jgi:8-oxo-dGTP diphosphatase